MTLTEAIKHSLLYHPEEWVFESEEQIKEDTYLTIQHKRIGMKVRVRDKDWSSAYEVWSPAAKMWEQQYDNIGGYGENMSSKVKWFRRSELNNDLNGRLVDQLEGAKGQFTDDANHLAKAVLDGRTDAAYALVDELLAQRSSE